MNKHINPIYIKEILKEDAEFIDLRDPYLYKQSHIKKFINIPYSQFSKSFPHLPFHKPIYLICQSGHQSDTLASKLIDMGYEAYSIDGGFQYFLSIPPSKYY